MRVFSELEKQYSDIDQEYARKEFQAQSKGWNRKEGEYQRKREINDHAYFLFMFTRLEARIRDESSLRIQKEKNSSRPWKQKVPWTFFPNQPDENRGINFKNRLALLIDNTGPDYNLVIDYYKERNSIAHGRSFTQPISMPIVINEFKRLYNILKA